MTMAALTDRDLVDALVENQAARLALDVAQSELVAEAIARGLAGSYGAKSTPELLRTLCRLDPRDAARRVAVAEAVGPRRNLTGEELGPVFPATAQAYRSGEIGNAHVTAIAAMIDALPDEVAVQCSEQLEQALVQVARTYDPTVAARQMRLVRAHVDAHGLYDEAALRHRRRGVSLAREADGAGLLAGELDLRLAESLHTVFDALARPTPGPSRERDHRSTRQRQHDALQTLCDLYLSGQLNPGTGGCRTTVILRMDVSDFAGASQGSGAGVAMTGHGYAVPAEIAKTWLEDEARAILVLLSKTKGIEAYSSASRLFTEQQRLAMLARDGGCSFPDCDTHLAYTQAHHVTNWDSTHRTCVDDGAPVCDGNHRIFEQAGWRSVMINGRPCWIPPTWIDPTQTPRRNTLHDLPARPAPPEPP